MGIFNKIKQALGLEDAKPAPAPVRLSPEERVLALRERENFITNLDIISDRDGTILSKDYDFKEGKLTSHLNVELFEALDHARQNGLKIAIATGGEPSIEEFKAGLGKLSKELADRVDKFLEEVPIISKGDIHFKMQQKEGAFHIDDSSSFIGAPDKSGLHNHGMGSNHIFPQFIDVIKAKIEEQIKAKTSTPTNDITQTDKSAEPSNKPRNNEQDKGSSPSH